MNYSIKFLAFLILVAALSINAYLLFVKNSKSLAERQVLAERIRNVEHDSNGFKPLTEWERRRVVSARRMKADKNKLLRKVMLNEIAQLSHDQEFEDSVWVSQVLDWRHDDGQDCFCKIRNPSGRKIGVLIYFAYKGQVFSESKISLTNSTSILHMKVRKLRGVASAEVAFDGETAAIEWKEKADERVFVGPSRGKIPKNPQEYVPGDSFPVLLESRLDYLNLKNGANAKIQLCVELFEED